MREYLSIEFCFFPILFWPQDSSLYFGRPIFPDLPSPLSLLMVPSDSACDMQRQDEGKDDVKEEKLSQAEGKNFLNIDKFMFPHLAHLCSSFVL